MKFISQNKISGIKSTLTPLAGDLQVNKYRQRKPQPATEAKLCYSKTKLKR